MSGEGQGGEGLDRPEELRRELSMSDSSRKGGREAGPWLEDSVVSLFVFSKEETIYRLRGKSHWRG